MCTLHPLITAGPLQKSFLRSCLGSSKILSSPTACDPTVTPTVNPTMTPTVTPTVTQNSEHIRTIILIVVSVGGVLLAAVVLLGIVFYCIKKRNADVG